MNIAFTFKNFEPSNHLKAYANRRFSKLGRFLLNPEHVEMQVSLSVDNFRHKAEISLVTDNFTYSATEQSEDMYATVDLIRDKLKAQIIRSTEKLQKKRKGTEKPILEGTIPLEEIAESERTIFGVSDFVPQPMDLDEAAMQLDALDYDFLVFLNTETERVNIMYRRKDNNFGLIDPAY
ncbi:ribosome hibernation-promoting factor, HPF/YfiA family [Halodesulfovibrio marinisediminis]|uniref:Ribosome hibernation promoting factor n=1 Tax=Halodesulfovibrio marinisediminis DSM 17456 TaxID=1121457 RepID=A0A1N6E6Z2_9BACT|nr:ribosome-associated translation inhibitor RaiA [Halodesulfovibrio marinisediminis]SIN78776.1 SSU ribosomal protein S30P /sigma 54 modulation protein [Halodesulfovibrio marinisediminis DSM 17456]